MVENTSDVAGAGTVLGTNSGGTSVGTVLGIHADANEVDAGVETALGTGYDVKRIGASTHTTLCLN